MASTALFAVGMVSLFFADSVAHFYIAEVIMGLAFNMANALPQSLAPALGGWLVASAGHGTQFLPLLLVAGIVTLLGALVIIPIKKVK
ncbi:hypothetical protein ACSDQ9_00975 [Aestuariimicrobium soli]|uniref:hypothetical protein n=1 Tax=Aestuariimicrobium soli TaxID=2035834 RepID=UPI003EC0F012